METHSRIFFKFSKKNFFFLCSNPTEALWPRYITVLTVVVVTQWLKRWRAQKRKGKTLCVRAPHIYITHPFPVERAHTDKRERCVRGGGSAETVSDKEKNDWKAQPHETAKLSLFFCSFQFLFFVLPHAEKCGAMDGRMGGRIGRWTVGKCDDKWVKKTLGWTREP